MEDQNFWLPAPDEALRLAQNEVHVWSFLLEQTEEIYQRLQATLSDDERQRAAQFKFERLQKRFVVARGALRDILRRYLKVAAEKIAFEYEAHGKPKLTEANNQNDIRFNLSHAENLALFAVSRGRAIGVDVEFIRPLADAEKIAKRFFAPRESSVFCALPAAQKPAAFFNCWARKEAFIKAIGEGLSHPLHRFDVSFIEGEPPALLSTRPNPEEARKWTLHALTPAPDHVGAFVVAGNRFDLTCWQWEAPLPPNRKS